MLIQIQNALGQISTHQGFRRYFTNTSWLLAERLLRIFAGLVVGVWVARYLGPERFGLFSYAVSFVAIFGVIARLGLDDIVIRELVLQPASRGLLLGTAFWLKFFGAVLTLGILSLATGVMTSVDDGSRLYIAIIAAGVIFQAFEVIDFYFQSQVLSKFVSLCRLFQLSVSSVLKLYLILTNASLVAFVFVSLIDQVTLSFTLFFAFRFKKIESFWGKFDFILARRLLKDSWPLILSSIAIMVYMRIDQIMIKAMLGEQQVGLYSAAVKLSEAWYFVPTILATSLFPSIINAKRTDQRLYHVRLQRLYTLVVWLGIVVATAVTLMNNWLVDILFGASYKGAGEILTVLVWSGVFVGIAVVKGRWQMAENLTSLHFYGALVGAICNILLNLYTIPLYGGLGAAVSTLIAQVVAVYGINYFFPVLRSQNRFIKKAFLLRFR